MGSTAIATRDPILLRLSKIGVPEDIIHQGERGLVTYLKENKSKSQDILLNAVLPSDEEVIKTINESNSVESEDGLLKLNELFEECIHWLRWLMFEDEPEKFLVNLGEMSVGQRGVCGAVWGPNNIAYRCKTCENDPTCAICETCFQQGDHKGHEFRLIHTAGGRCDCGDETALNRNGFCSMHKGAQQIQPLPEGIACIVRPVLDILFGYWEEKLLRAQAGKTLNDCEMVNILTSNVVEMLLEFCQHSESLLSFISRRVSVPLLGVLIRAERFLNKGITTKLHELLLRLLGDPVFKDEFAKVFKTYYLDTINKCIREGSESIEEGNVSVFEKYKLIPTFSVQIFTVPRLVKEMNLLGILFGCLEDLFSSCAGDERHIQVSKWTSLYGTTDRLLEDTRFVLNHADVAKYVTHEQPDISKTWIQLLAFVQGMDSQKRVTGLHVKEQNQNMHFPLMMGQSIEKIRSLLVNGAFSQQSSVCSTEGRTGTMDGTSQVAEECSSNLNGVSVPSTVTRLTCECLQAIEDWLGFNALQMEPHGSLSSSGNIADKRGYSLMDVSARSSSSGLSNEDILEAECSESESLGLLSSSDWPNIVYDVSSQDISVHIPLHQLLSLLLLKALRKCYGETGGSEINDFFGQMLPIGCHPVGFSAFIMEHPLRIKVFCAQVRADMWVKNGSVATLNCKWYRSWSEQGLELDIFLLQCCASLAPVPDLFVKRILERFGLASYLSLNPEPSNEHEAVLVQEMLTLIIQIIKERRFCGLSIDESLRRELVYKLASKDATSSKLVKSLPRDLSKNSQFQMILDSVADYSGPSGMEQGNYSLRMSCWKELDLYHPRWNSKNLQAAQERYLRFREVSALAVQLPRWTEVFYPLKGISRIATSRASLEIIRAVLYYASLKDEQLPSRAPDGVVLIALHLLSLGLDICCVQTQSSGPEEDPLPALLAFASEEISGGPSVGSDAVKQITMLSLLVSTMQKYKNSTFEAGQCDICAVISIILKRFANLSACCPTELKVLAPEVDFSTLSLNTEAEER